MRSLLLGSCFHVFGVVNPEPASGADRALFQALLRWAQDLLPLPKPHESLPIILSPEEVLHFLSCVRNLKFRTVLTTCYAAGLRISEAIYLKPTHIDSRRMIIRVEQGKGAKDRYVLLSAASRKSIRQGGSRLGRPRSAACARPATILKNAHRSPAKRNCQKRSRGFSQSVRVARTARRNTS